MKDKLKSILNKIKNNKKKVIGITFGVFAVFIFTFATYNLNNPTYFNRLFANVLNNGKPANDAFEDNTFYSCVVDAYNNANGVSKAYTVNLTDEELASITSLDCSGFDHSDNDKITSAKGVEKLTGLKRLTLHANKLTSIDLANNTFLKHLYLSINRLTSIDLSNNTSLTNLDLSYNQLTSIDVSKNTNLKELALSNNQLTSIDLSNDSALTDLNLNNNQLTYIDLSNNTSLTNLYLSNNQLTSIDLSQNAALTTLYLKNNPFENIPTMIVGEIYAIKDNIKLPNDKKATYSIEDTSIANVENGVITALQNGATRLVIDTGHTNEYEDMKIYISFTVQSAELSSNIYNINNDLKYIYTKGDIDTDTIKSNISTNIGEIEIENNTLKVTNNGKTLLTYNIINYVINDYTVNGNVITGIIDNFNKENINVTNGTYEINDNLLYIKDQNNNILETFNLKITKTSLLSEVYNINNDLKYIYTRNDTDINTIVSNISTNIGEIEIENNILKVTNNGKTLLTYNIINYVINDYTVNGNVITGIIDNFNKENINVTNGTYEINDNLLYIKDQNNNILETFNLEITKTSLLSEVYIINNDLKYIYTKNIIDINTIVSNISTNIGEIQIEDNMLKVLYNNEVLLEYKIVNFKIKNAVISGNTINAIKDKFSINDIKVNNGMYKLNDDNTLNIKYNDQVIDTLNIEIITPNIRSIGSPSFDYNINDNEKYIYIRYFSSESFLGDVQANIGNVVIEDNKAKIVYDGETLLEYKIIRYIVNGYTPIGSYGSYYLTIGNNVLNESDVSVINGDYEISDNNLAIKYNNKIIDTIPIISYQLDYDIINSYGNKYIYLKDKEFDSSKITVSNCEYKIEYNQLTIYSPTTILETINLASINLNGTELKGSSVYLGGMGNLYINGTNCDVNDLGNYIYQIIIGENIVDTISGIKIEASDWSIIERIDNYGYIYLGARSISELADFNIINGYSEETENELIIYESENKEYELKRLNILRISSDKYDLKSSYSKDNNAYYIYTKNKKIDVSSIRASDGIIIDDQVSYIAIRDSISGMDLESIKPVYVDVNKYSEYKLVDDCIYLGLINKNNYPSINVNNGEARKNGNQFDIYSGAGQKLDSLDIIALETDYLSYDVKDESESRSRYEYEFASSSLYLGVDTFNPAYITSKINSTYEYATDTSLLKIKHNDKLIEEIKVVNIYLPDKYKFIWDNLYLKDSEFKDSMVKSITNVKNIDKDKISVMNGKLVFVREEEEDDNGNTYFEEWLDVYTIDYDSSRYEDEDYRDSKYIKGDIGLASISSKKYDMSDDYIYLGTEDFDSDLEFKSWGVTYNTNKLLETNALKIDKNKIELWFTDEECDSKYVDGKYVETCSYEPVEKVDSWDLVKVLSDDFDLSTSSIDLNFDGIFSLDSVGITNGSISLEGDILVIKYKDKVVKEIKVNDAKKNTTTTKKVEDIENTTQNSSYTTTTKKRNIFSRLFGNKKTTTTAKKATSRKKIFRRTTKNKSSTTKVITNKNSISTTNKESDKTIRLNVKILVILLVSFNIIFVSALYLFKKDKFKEKGEK